MRPVLALRHVHDVNESPVVQPERRPVNHVYGWRDGMHDVVACIAFDLTTVNSNDRSIILHAAHDESATRVGERGNQLPERFGGHLNSLQVESVVLGEPAPRERDYDLKRPVLKFLGDHADNTSTAMARGSAPR